MGRRHLILTLASCLAAAGAMTGCGGDDGAVVVVPVATGFLDLEFTVDGTTDPEACVFYDLSDLELVVFDSFGRVYTEVFAPCESFGVSVELPEDEYSADATMLAPDGSPASTTLPLDAIQIIPNSRLVIDIDFPVDSLL